VTHPLQRHGDRPEISVVVPLYNEADTLPELYRRLATVLARENCAHELVFVDDGSRDATPRLLHVLHGQDRQVTTVTLSRNFGHQAALSAGLDHARGRAVVLMDGDLQDPPEMLAPLLAGWRDGFEVVYTVRTRRQEGLLKRTCYAAFYRVLRAVSDLDIPLDSGDFCLLDRKVVLALRRMPERQRFLRGLRAFAGFRQQAVPYERAARQAGRSKYTLRALVRLALDGLLGFSAWPLRLATYVGLVFAVLAVFLAACVAGSVLGDSARPASGTIVLLAVLVIGAGQMLGLGILGEYMHRVYVEVTGRPSYIVSQVRRGKGNSARKRRRNRSSVA
jgi:glycosyltransferase involved in cell wall biosynthesis